MMVRQRGLTLLEVLVALAITAMSVSVVYQIYATGARSVSRAERLGQAVLHSRRLLADVADAAALQPGLREGRIDDVRWQMQIRPDETQSGPSVRGYWLDLTLSWPGGGQYQLRSYRAQAYQ